VNEEENWPHGEQIHCPHCHLLLERADHSPFLDDYSLYCNRCPIRVEVSSYDPVVEQVQNQVRQATGTDQGERYYGALMRAVEARLKPCRCGGVFCYDAPRRCFRCHTPVISEHPQGIDLYPEWREDLENDEIIKRTEHFEAQFIRKKDIWQEAHL